MDSCTLTEAGTYSAPFVLICRLEFRTPDSTWLDCWAFLFLGIKFMGNSICWSSYMNWSEFWYASIPCSTTRNTIMRLPNNWEQPVPQPWAQRRTLTEGGCSERTLDLFNFQCTCCSAPDRELHKTFNNLILYHFLPYLLYPVFMAASKVFQRNLQGSFLPFLPY